MERKKILKLPNIFDTQKEGKGVDFPFPKLFGRLADEILNKYAIKNVTEM